MPYYFFDLYDGACTMDREGTSLPGLECARREAIRTLTGVSRDVFYPSSKPKRVVVQVRNDVGQVVITVQVDASMRDGP